MNLYQKKISKLFQENLVDWESLVFKSDQEEYDFLKTKKNTLSINKLRKHISSKKNNYNHLKGNFADYKALSSFGKILNKDEFHDFILKNEVKYKVAPLDIKKEIDLIINEKIELLEEIFFDEKKPTIFFNLEDEHFFFKKEKLEFINLNSKNKIKNTTPRYIDENISKFIKKQESLFWEKFKVEKKDAKIKLLNNLKIKNEADNFWKNKLAPNIVNRLITNLQLSNVEETYNIFKKIFKDPTQIEKNKLEEIKKFKFSIKQISNTTFLFGDLFKIRIKYSNGNLVSNIKMNVEILLNDWDKLHIN